MPRAAPAPTSAPASGSACGPVTAGAWNSAAGWVVKGSRMSHACDPYVGDLCNAVKVQTSRTLQYLFAPTIGIASGSTGVVQSVACQGACKRDRQSSRHRPRPRPHAARCPPRTSQTSRTRRSSCSRSTTRRSNHVAVLLRFPIPSPSNKCKVASPQNYPDSTPRTWRAVPLSTDYKNAAGVLDPTSAIVTTINCLALAASPTIMVAGNNSPSQSHTNLGDPMAAAAELLRQDGRADVPDVIIFMTDGQANQPWDPARGFDTPCSYADGKANTAKTQGVVGKGQAEIYTIGYGIDSTTLCPDTTGTYQNGGSRPRATTAPRRHGDELDRQCVPGRAPIARPTRTPTATTTSARTSDGNLAAVFKQVAIALGQARAADRRRLSRAAIGRRRGCERSTRGARPVAL